MRPAALRCEMTWPRRGRQRVQLAPREARTAEHSVELGEGAGVARRRTAQHHEAEGCVESGRDAVLVRVRTRRRPRALPRRAPPTPWRAASRRSADRSDGGSWRAGRVVAVPIVHINALPGTVRWRRPRRPRAHCPRRRPARRASPPPRPRSGCAGRRRCRTRPGRRRCRARRPAIGRRRHQRRHFSQGRHGMGILSVLAGTLWTVVAGGRIGVALIGRRVPDRHHRQRLDSIPGHPRGGDGGRRAGKPEPRAEMDPLVGGGSADRR